MNLEDKIKLGELFVNRVKITDESECWLWIGKVNRKVHGYGNHVVRRKANSAHRFAYEALRERIPKGYHIHHVCENKLCVNPDHMEVVEASAHMKLHRRPKTHCVRGHKYDEENTYMRSDGAQSCRACKRIRHKKYRQQKKLTD